MAQQDYPKLAYDNSGKNESSVEKPVIDTKNIPVAPGGSGPYDPSMEARVAILETHMEYVRADLSEIKAGQKATEAALASLASATEKLSSKIDISELKISNQLKDLPTKSELKNYNLQMIGIGIAILILVIGGIIGGLAILRAN